MTDASRDRPVAVAEGDAPSAAQLSRDADQAAAAGDLARARTLLRAMLA